MNKEAVQHERGPRNATLRRQMSLYFKERPADAPGAPSDGATSPPGATPGAGFPLGRSPPLPPPPPTFLPGPGDLALAKSYQFHLSLVHDARHAALAAAAAAVAAASSPSPAFSMTMMMT